MEVSDSPSFVRMADAAALSAASTCSLSSASACSLRERLTIFATGGAKDDRVGGPETRDRTVDHRLFPFAGADFASNLVRDSVACSTTHETETLANRRVVHDLEEWRLLELCGQCFA